MLSKVSVVFVAFWFQFGVCVAADNPAGASASWREFRGNTANGLALSAELPTQWSETENCTWKLPIHGRGWSSPVVDSGEIWVTTAAEDGATMSLLCIDFQSGEIVFDEVLFENDELQPDYHLTNSYASPTPVLNATHVFAHFGAYGTACVDRKTREVVWQRQDLPCNHYRGPGSSPILYQGNLIFHMDGFDFQYAVALDVKTGETVWKVNRDIEYDTENGDFYKAFSTPLIIQADGADQLISPASKACVALNPATGKELWRVRYAEHSTTVRPVFDGTRVILSTGFGKAKMMCVRVDGSGDVTKTHVDWIQSDGIGSKPSPVIVGGRLFAVSDKGILSRLDLSDGKMVARIRLGGNFAASLIATAKHIYAFDQTGTGHVYSVADKPQLVSKNQLPDGCNASPAVVGNSLVVRTVTHLYRFDRS